jgi:glycosyltransferase involved in cell wall biosynthesis
MLDGIEVIEWLIIDDGSTDNTTKVAKEYGVDHVVKLPSNLGLARAFQEGVKACLRLGADIIVNTDADNQYQSQDIPLILEPILSQRAQMVVGSRDIVNHREFSPLKKYLQRIGSHVVRVISGTSVRDAPSGFRAISRSAAIHLNVFSKYTYTIETIIQCGQKGISVESVPIRVNPELRPSRLMRSKLSYIRRSIGTMLRISILYRPFQSFLMLGVLFLTSGTGIGIRFLTYYLDGAGEGKIQSLILAGLLIGIGFILCVSGVIADLIAANRIMLEKVSQRTYEIEDNIEELTKNIGLKHKGGCGVE